MRAGRLRDRRLTSDSLYRNSFYLMVSTAVLSLSGFAFWFSASRLLSPAEVGLATTAVSASALLSYLSLLGLPNGIIRFLPTSPRQHAKITSTSIVVTASSVAVSGVFLAGLDTFSPSLLSLRRSPETVLMFVAFIVASSLNLLIESVLIAYRSAALVAVKNTMLSVVRGVLPFALVGYGAIGMITSVAVGTLCAYLTGAFLLIKRLGYRFQPRLDVRALQTMATFSLNNFVAGLFVGLPNMLLPLIVANRVGVREAAFFFIPMSITAMVFIIPLAMSQAMFAESSRDEGAVFTHARKAMLSTAALLLPAMAVTALAGRRILLIFGQEYASNGWAPLQLLVGSSLFVTVPFLGNTVLNVRRRTTMMVKLAALHALVVVGLAALLAGYGVTGVSLGWLIGQAVTAAAYVPVLRGEASRVAAEHADAERWRVGERGDPDQRPAEAPSTRPSFLPQPRGPS